MSSVTKILLAISTSRYSQNLVFQVMEEAKSGIEQGVQVQIDVLYVIEEEELKKVSDQIGSQAFWGPSIQKDVVEALGNEHHRMALQRIAEVQKEAREIDCEVNTFEVKGKFSTAVIKHAENHPCDVIFITRDDRPFISRVLFGSEADRVARLAKKKEGFGRVIIDQ